MTTNIVLVEPDAILARMYTKTLQRNGFSITKLQSAEQAILHLDKAQPPSLIILDLQLPGHNGVEFLYELRSYADWVRIPIIVLSEVPKEALAMTKFMQQKLGIRKFLKKSQTDLAELQRHVINEVKQER